MRILSFDEKSLSFSRILPFFATDGSAWVYGGNPAEVSVEVFYGADMQNYQAISGHSLASAGPSGLYRLSIPSTSMPSIQPEEFFLLRITPASAGAFEDILVYGRYLQQTTDSVLNSLNNTLATRFDSVDADLDSVLSDLAETLKTVEANVEKTITYDENGRPTQIDIKYVLDDAAPDFSTPDRVDQITITRDSSGRVTGITRKQVQA